MNRSEALERSPSDVTDREMEILADHLSNFLELLEDVFIIPEGLRGSEKMVRKSMATTHELIDRLRKGDRRVFKEDDECDLL